MCVRAWADADYWPVVGMQVQRKVRGEALFIHTQTTKHFLSVARTHTVFEAAYVFPNRVSVFFLKVWHCLVILRSACQLPHHADCSCVQC